MTIIAAEERALTTADLAAAHEPSTASPELASQLDAPAPDDRHPNAISDAQLAPLFSPDAANEFRTHWDSVQISFVDDPKQAVRKADELVAQVMKSLAESFSIERTKLEGQVDPTAQGSTENLRALQRYRSFFQRLLSV